MDDIIEGGGGGGSVEGVPQHISKQFRGEKNYRAGQAAVTRGHSSQLKSGFRGRVGEREGTGGGGGLEITPSNRNGENSLVYDNNKQPLGLVYNH